MKQTRFTEMDYIILRNSLAQLSKTERKVIYLRFWENMTIQEIAKMHRMSWERVDNLIDETLLKLRVLHEMSTSFAMHLSSQESENAA